MLKYYRRMLQAYHTKNSKLTNMHGNRSISSTDVRNCYCQPSNVASYPGLAMSAATIRFQKSY